MVEDETNRIYDYIIIYFNDPVKCSYGNGVSEYKYINQTHRSE